MNLGDKDGKYPPELQAAIVTGVYEDLTGTSTMLKAANEFGAKVNSMFVDLKVLYRTGSFDMQKVPFSEVPQPGNWSWPSRA